MGVFSGNFLRSLRGNQLHVLTQIVDLNQVKKVLHGLGADVSIPDDEPLGALLPRCLDQAFQEGWGDIFVARIWAASSRSGPLRDFLRRETNSAVVQGGVAAAQMEEVLRSSQSYLDAGQWLLRLAQISHQVCQVEMDG